MGPNSGIPGQNRIPNQALPKKAPKSAAKPGKDDKDGTKT
jgi:hypothetical protein